MNRATVDAILRDRSVKSRVDDDGGTKAAASAELNDGKVIHLVPCGNGCTVGIVFADGTSICRAVDSTTEAREWLNAALDSPDRDAKDARYPRSWNGR